MYLILSFPVFYYAIKEHVSISQYNAINMLFLGKYRSSTGENEDYISDLYASSYCSGKRKISRDYIEKIISLSRREVRHRINSLGFQDISKVAGTLRNLVECTSLNNKTRRILATLKDDLDFITEVFLMSIKCPPQHAHSLTADEKIKIKSCFYTEIHSEKDDLSCKYTDQISTFAIQTATAEKRMLECKLITRGSKISALYEITNVMLSAGITALSEFFSSTIMKTHPLLLVYDSFDVFEEDLLSNNNVNILHETFVAVQTGLDEQDYKKISEYIILSLNSESLNELFDTHVVNHNLYFPSFREEREYETSMHNELGNIFSSWAATALSNFIDHLIEVKKMSFPELTETLSPHEIIFAGVVDFKTVHDDLWRAYLLLNSNALSILTDMATESNI